MEDAIPLAFYVLYVVSGKIYGKVDGKRNYPRIWLFRLAVALVTLLLMTKSLLRLTGHTQFSETWTWPLPIGIALVVLTPLALLLLAFGEGHHDDRKWNHLRGWFALVAVGSYAALLVTLMVRSTPA